jgi:hypothetical protein
MNDERVKEFRNLFSNVIDRFSKSDQDKCDYEECMQSLRYLVGVLLVFHDTLINQYEGLKYETR